MLFGLAVVPLVWLIVAVVSLLVFGSGFGCPCFFTSSIASFAAGPGPSVICMRAGF